MKGGLSPQPLKDPKGCMPVRPGATTTYLLEALSDPAPDAGTQQRDTRSVKLIVHSAGRVWCCLPSATYELPPQ